MTYIGIVRNNEGKPIAGAQVWLSDAAGAKLSAVIATNSTGAYTLEGSGSYITVSVSGCTTSTVTALPDMSISLPCSVSSVTSFKSLLGWGALGVGIALAFGKKKKPRRKRKSAKTKPRR